MSDSAAGPALYLVGTPIGNLEDITLRALRVLKEVDVIACEDTRQTQKLLNHYAIVTRTTSYRRRDSSALTDFSFSGAGTSNSDSGCRPVIVFSGFHWRTRGKWKSALRMVKTRTVIAWHRKAFGCIGVGRVATSSWSSASNDRGEGVDSTHQCRQPS